MLFYTQILKPVSTYPLKVLIAQRPLV